MAYEKKTDYKIKTDPKMCEGCFAYEGGCKILRAKPNGKCRFKKTKEEYRRGLEQTSGLY